MLLHKLARFPVREGDKITGIANVYEILFAGLPRSERGEAGKRVGDLMQKAQFVSATDRINHILPVLRASRTPISIVINAESKAVGIVTIEDIVEEIVGEVEG